MSLKVSGSDVLSLQHPIFESVGESIITTLLDKSVNGEFMWIYIGSNLMFSRQPRFNKADYQVVDQIPANMYTFVQYLELIGFTFDELCDAFVKNNHVAIVTEIKKLYAPVLPIASQPSQPSQPLSGKKLSELSMDRLNNRTATDNPLSKNRQKIWGILQSINPVENEPLWKTIGHKVSAEKGSCFITSHFEHGNLERFANWLVSSPNKYTAQDLKNDLIRYGYSDVDELLPDVY